MDHISIKSSVYNTPKWKWSLEGLFVDLGPVVRSLVSANHWLRGIKTYRFPWYLTLVSANHASSNPGLACCHGNRYDVISALKVLPNSRVAKIFIVCLQYGISFFGIFHCFTNTIGTEKTLSSLLKLFGWHSRTLHQGFNSREFWI